MTGFEARPIAQAKTVGEQLQAARLAEGRSIDYVATQLNIRTEYIKAMEASDYHSLPSAVFVKQYVRQYAKYLRLNLRQVEETLQHELIIYQRRVHIPTIKRHLLRQPLKVIHVIIGLSIIFSIVAAGIYFVAQISNIIQPPPLLLDGIPVKVPTSQRSITVSGKTAPEAIILINNQAITVRSDGSFSQVMTLQPGINLFKITAKTKRSRDKIEYQQIVVEDE